MNSPNDNAISPRSNVYKWNAIRVFPNYYII